MNPSTVAVNAQPQRMGLVLTCEGMGDCLFALAVIRKLKRVHNYRFDLFTLHPELFTACPYVDSVRHLDEARGYPHQSVKMFDLAKLPHWKMDTFDFISVPIGQGTLSFAEKQLEYFPTEPDRAQAFDVVLNTSRTWRTRSWPIESWQRLADTLVARGLKVAVVGRDTPSKSDNMVKKSLPLSGNVTNLVNALSLDQTYYTLAKAGLFVSGQGGLTVLAGATDTEIVVLGMSIEWSKRAIYRNANPFHKVTYVEGACDVFCGGAEDCRVPAYDFKCVPTYEQVEAAVLAKLPH